MPGVQTEGEPKTAEELQTELDALTKTHTNLSTAHEKLKQDHRDLKATHSDAAELTKQIERLHSEKAKLLKENGELQVAFDDYRSKVQEKDLKVSVLTALSEVSGSPETCLKLLDLSTIKLNEQGEPTEESLTAAIDALKTTDPILFGETTKAAPKTPPIKAAIEKQTQSAYETELAAAVKAGSWQQYDEVMAKYKIGA